MERFQARFAPIHNLNYVLFLLMEKYLNQPRVIYAWIGNVFGFLRARGMGNVLRGLEAGLGENER